MPVSRQASATSSITSRPKGVASTTLYFDTLERKSAKPSWCFDVMTKYFIPASRARFIQSLGSNRTGLNALASAAYSFIGMRSPHCSHSA